MAYPVSDHFDGSHFFNPEPAIAGGGRRRGLFGLLMARLRRDPAEWSRWPDRLANTPYPPVVLPAEASGVTFIGHSSFLLRLPGIAILTDPVFSKRASPFRFIGPRRVRPPGMALADLPEINLTLLSHNHYDHMDLASLRALRRRYPAMRIIAPLGNAAYLATKRIAAAQELDWWQSVEAAPGIRITATPARHFSARWLHDRNATLWAGFMIAAAGMKIHFAGDTGYTRFFAEIRQRLGAPDLALLPIGAYAPRRVMQTVHMNPAEAVRAFTDLGTAAAIGMHFGSFQLTAEPIDQPAKDLQAALSAAGIEMERFVTLDVGETKIFPASGAGSGNRTRASSLGS